MSAPQDPSLPVGARQNGASVAPAEPYPVLCYTCNHWFDAFQAAWCSCVVSRRSLVCPSCSKCFCAAPQSYKQQFWEKAPQRLWDLAAAEHATHATLPSNPEVAPGDHPLVLIVDDDKTILQIAAAAVTSLGYTPIVANNGEEGIAAAIRYKPRLILSDAFMPGLDGREMCRRIKADARTSAVKVVIMTSVYTASRYKYEAYKDFQADDYLSKPLELETLRGLLQKHLGSAT
jgi:CheY-like chemotaxis protein